MTTAFSQKFLMVSATFHLVYSYMEFGHLHLADTYPSEIPRLGWRMPRDEDDAGTCTSARSIGAGQCLALGKNDG